MNQGKKKDLPEFKKGEKVKSRYGETRAVSYQEGIQVFVNSNDINFYHNDDFL